MSTPDPIRNSHHTESAKNAHGGELTPQQVPIKHGKMPSGQKVSHAPRPTLGKLSKLLSRIADLFKSIPKIGAYAREQRALKHEIATLQERITALRTNFVESDVEQLSRDMDKVIQRLDKLKSKAIGHVAKKARGLDTTKLRTDLSGLQSKVSESKLARTDHQDKFKGVMAELPSSQTLARKDHRAKFKYVMAELTSRQTLEANLKAGAPIFKKVVANLDKVQHLLEKLEKEIPLAEGAPEVKGDIKKLKEFREKINARQNENYILIFAHNRILNDLIDQYFSRLLDKSLKNTSDSDIKLSNDLNASITELRNITNKLYHQYHQTFDLRITRNLIEAEAALDAAKLIDTCVEQASIEEVNIARGNFDAALKAYLTNLESGRISSLKRSEQWTTQHMAAALELNRTEAGIVESKLKTASEPEATTLRHQLQELRDEGNAIKAELNAANAILTSKAKIADEKRLKNATAALTKATQDVRVYVAHQLSPLMKMLQAKYNLKNSLGRIRGAKSMDNQRLNAALKSLENQKLDAQELLLELQTVSSLIFKGLNQRNTPTQAEDVLQIQAFYDYVAELDKSLNDFVACIKT